MNQIRNFSYTYNKLNQEQNDEYSSYVNNAYEQTNSDKETNNKNQEQTLNYSKQDTATSSTTSNSTTNIISETNSVDQNKERNNDSDMNRNIIKLDLDKKNDKPKNKLPKSAILSWDSVTIKADTRSTFQKLFNCVGKKRYITILNNVKGIVKPTEMLALMGPR